jgi:hypothetical protein
MRYQRTTQALGPITKSGKAISLLKAKTAEAYHGEESVSN